MESDTPLHQRIAASKLTSSETRVATFMAANPALVAVSSTAELGELTQSSDATVVRTAKKLGYDSFRDLRRSALDISERHRDPSRVLDHQLDQVSGPASSAATVLHDTAGLIQRLKADLDVTVWNRAVDILSTAERVFCYGGGPSGCIADYLSISLKRVGRRSSSITTTGFRLADDLLDLRDRDAVVLFATLRRFREIDVIVSHARQVGAKILLVSETQGEALRTAVDVVLSTPQSTTGTSDGVIVGMVLARALELSVAGTNQAAAVRSLERLNSLRTQIVGGRLDADNLPLGG